MNDKVLTAIVTVLTSVIGVAIIAVLVSRQSQTSQVLQAGGNAFSGILGTALSPVTGNSLLSGVGALGSGLLAGRGILG